MILFTCCGICFASIFVKDFFLFSLVKISSFFVFGDVLYGLLMDKILASENGVGKCSLLIYFWGRVYKD